MEISNVKLREGEGVDFEIKLDGKTFSFRVSREALEARMGARSLQGTMLLAAFGMARNKVLDVALKFTKLSGSDTTPILLQSKDF